MTGLVLPFDCSRYGELAVDKRVDLVNIAHNDFLEWLAGLPTKRGPFL